DEIGGDQAAHRHPDDMRPPNAESIHETKEIGHGIVWCRHWARAPEAADIVGGHAKGFSERGDLWPPHPVVERESVDQDDIGAGSSLLIVQLGTVHLDGAVTLSAGGGKPGQRETE